MEQLAKGVFAIIHDDAIQSFPDGSTDWPHSNVGVVVGDSGVLIVDSNFYPSRATADIALVRRVTNKPVRFLVNTHWHGDHTHGNAVYQDSFPRMTIVGARDNGQFIGVNQARYPLSAIAPGSTTRALLASHEAMLARGTDSTGRSLTTADRALLARVIAQRRKQLAEFALVRPAAPTVLFDREMSIDLGGRVVQLVDRGHANSPNDVTIYLPAEGILFTGDIVVWPVPYTFDAYPRPWARVLQELENLPAVAIVPGHGPVMADHAYIRQVRGLLETAIAQVDTMMRRGRLRPDVEQAANLERLKPSFVQPGDATAEAYWDAAVKHSLIERVYQCLQGSRC